MEQKTVRKKVCSVKNVQETNALEAIAANQSVVAVIVVAQHALPKAADHAITTVIHKSCFISTLIDTTSFFKGVVFFNKDKKCF
ncbi:MAG: hypothetical protein S4CHLAM6_03380 [Chlamydiae bacterium]|nr:hypothetical protein [Chlamydiota bacterium]